MEKIIIRYTLLAWLLLSWGLSLGQKELPVKFNEIGATSTPSDSPVKMELAYRYQNLQPSPKVAEDSYDRTIYSPKSALFHQRKNKLYVNSLEGYSTSVYDMESKSLIKVIKHEFDDDDLHLFQDTTLFDYQFANRKSRYNIFKGKPVEASFSHLERYLWVTYYRRDYDRNAISPSAVAIIDTDTDEIVRVMPTAPLPKMIARSTDDRYMAVTHWGDNTVGIIDISSDSAKHFFYVKLFEVGNRLKLNYKSNVKVNRDVGCGYCLRGTTFSADGKVLMIGRMGGGGIAMFDMDSLEYLGTIFGMKNNIRHIITMGDDLVISNNNTGFIQKTNLSQLISAKLSTRGENLVYKNWQSLYLGGGVRTIVGSSDDHYIFAAVNKESRVVAVRSEDMRIVASIDADSFPVGMAISANDELLAVTAQGRKGRGGHSVMIYKIQYTD